MTDHSADREMQRLADALSADWDAINYGGEHVAPGAAEPLIETARRLHAVDTTPPLSRQRRDRIWRGIMAAHASAASPSSALPRVDTAIKALPERGSSIAPGAPLDRSRSPFSAWIGTQLATAALLLLTLAVGYVAFGRSHANLANQELPGVPSLVTSTATTDPAANQSEIVFQATIDRLPPLASWAGIERFTLDPGVAISRGRDQDNGEGPLLYVVESGELTIQADGPVTVTRAGTETPRTIEPGTDTTLHVGDRGFAPSGVASRWRNDGTTPVRILDAGITTTGSGWADTFRAGITSASLVEEAQVSQRHSAITMTVSRITLRPGATLAADALPGIEMFTVESGKLEAVDTTTTGTAPPFAFDKGSILQRSFRPGRVFRGADDQPVTMLVMTITPAEIATPAPT